MVVIKTNYLLDSFDGYLDQKVSSLKKSKENTCCKSLIQFGKQETKKGSNSNLERFRLEYINDFISIFHREH